jgi:hypothetical protein
MIFLTSDWIYGSDPGQKIYLTNFFRNGIYHSFSKIAKKYPPFGGYVYSVNQSFSLSVFILHKVSETILVITADTVVQVSSFLSVSKQ